jgi:A/G-specific adenine glycosylase
MSSQTAKPDPKAIAEDLVAWYQQHARDYPWRRTRDPYAILVAEVMLQQTQIATVLGRGYYARWLERFPDFLTLATAREDEVLKAWEGLGYYRRARNLQRLAGEVLGNMPERFHASLPPFSHCLALALIRRARWRAFAFGLAEPIVDGNIARGLVAHLQ